MIAIGGLGIIIAIVITGITHKNESSDEMNFEVSPDEKDNKAKTLVSKRISAECFSGPWLSKQTSILKLGRIQVSHFQ